MFQKYLQHRIKREEAVTQSRINFTWRWMERHENICGALNHRRKQFEDDRGL